MGKHDIERKNNKKVIFFIIALIILLILIIAGVYVHKNKELSQYNNSIQEDTTIKGNCLVLKSNVEKGKTIEYQFKNNIVETIIIEENFESKEKYDSMKKIYEQSDDIIIKQTNDKELIITIEKINLEDDEGLSYEEIYDKYLVKLLDIYEEI